MALAPVKKNQYTMSLRQHKSALKKAKQDATMGGASERDQLLGATYVDLPIGDDRSRLLSGTQKLEDASRRLEDAHRMALETEQIGVGTLEDLHRQREQIERTRDGVSLIDLAVASE